MEKKLDQFGSLLEGQRNTLAKIASEHGFNNVIFGDGTPEENFKIEEIKGSCGKCKDGLILASHKINWSWFVFKCPCNVGRKRLEKYPLWSDSDEFEIEKATDDSEKSIFSIEDVMEMFDMMKKRMRFEISSEELDQYGKLVQRCVDEKRGLH